MDLPGGIRLCSDFYKRFDIRDALCITVPCPLPQVIGVGWHDSRVFTERERLLADLVRPHIAQAWSNAMAVDRLRSQLRTLQLGIDALGQGVIRCGPQGQVQFMNTQATRQLAQFFGVTRQTDRHLPPDLLLWVRKKDSDLYKSDDAPPARSPLVREKENKRLLVRLLSQPDANLILMEEEQSLPEASTFQTMGLTAREAEVLTWIARGKTNREIAIILDMHTSTVKKHVEHIFVKLGVENRTAAATIALAAGLPEAVY